MTTNLFIQDVTLRDGMHAVRHRITPTDVGRIVAALEAAGSTPSRSRTEMDWPAGRSIAAPEATPIGNGSRLLRPT